MNENGKYRIAILCSFPIHYLVPLFRKLSAHPNVDAKVYFCSKSGAIEPYLDPEFGKLAIKWDIDLLNGYKFYFLRNISPKPNLVSFWGQFNPSIAIEIWQKRYDAILVFGYRTATEWITYLSAWLNHTPILFRGEVNFFWAHGFTKRLFKRLLLVPLFKRIDAFLFSCSKSLQYYKHYGVPDKKLFFVPCAVDNDFFQTRADELRASKAHIKARLGIPQEAAVILYVGKLCQRKRPIDILKAFECICHGFNTWLIFLGDGPLKPAMVKYAKDRGLKKISFIGFKNQSEIAQYYTVADIFVLASESDPSPKVLNEAMNFRLPVIVTDGVGTAEDLIKCGENGFIYTVGHVDTLRDYLRKLLKEPALREKMGQRSLEIISEWNFEKDVQGILAALDYIHNRYAHDA